MTRRSPTSKAARAVKKLVYSHFPFMLGHSCGKLALYMRVMPAEGLALTQQDLIYPNGSVPAADKDIICFSCKKPLAHQDFDPENIWTLQ